MKTLLRSHFSCFPKFGVATSIRCRDLLLSAFTAFLCRDFDSMSRPHFCCRSLCFLVTANLFMLRRHLVVLSLQEGHDSTLLVCLFSCRDQVISLISAILVATSKVCRDLNSMSRPHFFCQQLILGHNSLFHVATQNCLSFHCLVATWDLGQDINCFFSLLKFMARP